MQNVLQLKPVVVSPTSMACFWKREEHFPEPSCLLPTETDRHLVAKLCKIIFFQTDPFFGIFLKIISATFPFVQNTKKWKKEQQHRPQNTFRNYKLCTYLFLFKIQSSAKNKENRIEAGNGPF